MKVKGGRFNNISKIAVLSARYYTTLVQISPWQNIILESETKFDIFAGEFSNKRRRKNG